MTSISTAVALTAPATVVKVPAMEAVTLTVPATAVDLTNPLVGALYDAVAYMKTVHIDTPADPTLPMFVIPKNTLTAGGTVPASAVNKDGTMNFDDIAWWPVV